jgi:hypothetical protein
MIQGERPDEPQAEMIDAAGAGRPLGPIGTGSSRSILVVVSLIVVLGLAGLVAVTSLGRSVPSGPARPSNGPSGGFAAGPGPSPSPSAASLPLAGVPAIEPLDPSFPATVDNLKVSSVSAALAAGPSDRAGLVALGGFLSSNRAMDGCPLQPRTDKPDPCSGTRLVLVDRPAVVLTPNLATFLYDIAVPTAVASVEPIVLPGTTVPDPWANARTLDDRLAPRPVVLVGRFDDPRSPDCAARPGAGSVGCDRSFVVQQLAWLDGYPTTPGVFVEPGLKPSQSWQGALRASADWFLPSNQPATISISGLRASDAARLAGVDLDELGSRLVWIVHVVSPLAAGPASSFLVFDDRSLSLLEVNP